MLFFPDSGVGCAVPVQAGRTQPAERRAGQRGHLLRVWLPAEDSEESLDGASLLSSLRALLTHFLFLFRRWQRWKVIHYLVENILTFAGRQVAEIVRRRQLHEPVENREVIFFFFGEKYQTVWGLPAPGESTCRPGIEFELFCLCLPLQNKYFQWFSWNRSNCISRISWLLSCYATQWVMPTTPHEGKPTCPRRPSTTWERLDEVFWRTVGG